MPSVFDGMTGVLNGVFGAPVTVLPQSGGMFVIQSIFREEPTAVIGEDGREILTVVTLWKVPRADAVSILRGDRVEPGNGKAYLVRNNTHTGSPASDRFVIFELEEIAA